MAPKATQTKSFNGRTVRTIQGLGATATPPARQPLSLFQGMYGQSVQPATFQRQNLWADWAKDVSQDLKKIGRAHV